MHIPCAMQELQSQGIMAKVDPSKSILTKLMCNSLGGNAWTLFIGVFKQGQLSESEALLKLLQVATTVESFPIRNEARARGLLSVLFNTISQLKGERNALEQQLDEGGSQVSGIPASKVSRLMEQNLQLKEEVAAVIQEKSGLQQKLDSLHQAGMFLRYAALSRRQSGMDVLEAPLQICMQTRNFSVCLTPSLTVRSRGWLLDELY